LEYLHLVSILLFSVSTNLDNYGVGLAYGIRNICVPFRTNAFIAFVNAMGTLLSMLVGEQLYVFVKPDTATALGSLLFVSAGAWLIAKNIYVRLKKQEPRFLSLPAAPAAPSDGRLTLSKSVIYCRYCESHIPVREGILLALALTLSNLTTGVGAALVGLNIALSVFLVFIFGISALSLGVKTGACASGLRLEKSIDIIAGLLLVLIGIYEYAL
jgi:putative Mn2+ efflux pump MntP